MKKNKRQKKMPEAPVRSLNAFDAKMPIILYKKEYDADKGLWNFLGMDINFEKITGFPYSVFKNNRMSWTKRLHPDDSVTLIEKVKEFENGTDLSAEFAYRWLHRDGTYHWFINCATIIKSPNKKYREIVGSLIDVSVHVQARKTLQENEIHYKQIAELSPHALFVHSDGVFRFLNSAGLKLFGAQKSHDLIGKPVLDFIHSDYRDQKMKIQNEVIAYKIIQIDGTVKDVEMASSPFVFEGKPAVQDMVIDVTKFKQAEEVYKTATNELENLNKILMRRDSAHVTRDNTLHTTSFDSEKSILFIGLTEIKIQKFSRQYSLLSVVFKDSDSSAKDWQFSEISELMDIEAQFDWKKLYNIADAIRKNIAIETGIKDFFILTTQSLKISPHYLTKNL